MDNDKIEFGIPSKMPDDIESIREAIEGLDYHIDALGNKVPIKADVGIPYGSTEATIGNDPIMHPTLHDNDDIEFGIPMTSYDTSEKEQVEPLLEKRKNIEFELSKTFEYTFGKVNYSPNEIMDRLKRTLEIIEEAYSHSPNIVDRLLGGELNKDAIYMGSKPSYSSFPLYFIIDLIIKTTSKFHMEKFSNKEEILTTLAKFQLLRDKSTNLKFDSIFNPNEPINESTMENIIGSKGDFRRSIEKEEGIEYLGITIDRNNQDVVYKNGDYYVEGETRYWSTKPTTLYKKDQKLIDEKVSERVKLIQENFKKVVCKYFKDGKIPTTHEFHSSLIDRELDDRLVSILFSISLVKDKFPFYDGMVAISAKEKIAELERVEKIVLEEIKEKEELVKRTNAIEEAKERYNSKSFLWRLVNKKTNPLNMDYDSMKTEEIESLYRR